MRARWGTSCSTVLFIIKSSDRFRNLSLTEVVFFRRNCLSLTKLNCLRKEEKSSTRVWNIKNKALFVTLIWYEFSNKRAFRNKISTLRKQRRKRKKRQWVLNSDLVCPVSTRLLDWKATSNQIKSFLRFKSNKRQFWCWSRLPTGSWIIQVIHSWYAVLFPERVYLFICRWC